nr:putative disease resistance protein RGA4 [Ziziphus jujuba var. spinosa]
MGSKFPSWLMNHYLTNLVELSLIKCCRCVQLPSLGKLPLLEFLTIDEMDATMYFCSDSKENTGVADVVSLKRPSLKSMPNLLGWSSAEGRVILSCLKELEDILMNVTEMTSPSNITLGGFEELVDLPQGLLSNKTGLLSFEIKDCPKLVNFSGELNSLSLLQSLSISNCPNIKCLSELGVLKALKSLAIDRCHGLLSLPEEEIQGLTSLQHFSLSNRENITVLPYTMQQFTNLQTLHIWSCPKVDSLPEWLGNLVSLRELELWYCENLLYLPESMQGLTALQFLSIWGCPQLEIHLEKDRGPDWYKIQHIPFIKVNGPYIQAIG